MYQRRFREDLLVSALHFCTFPHFISPHHIQRMLEAKETFQIPNSVSQQNNNNYLFLILKEGFLNRKVYDNWKSIHEGKEKFISQK